MTDRLPDRRTALLAGLALATLPALTACGSQAAKTTSLHQLAAPASRTAVGLTDVANLAGVVTGVRNFGNACWRASAAIGQNYTASPFSIAVAFGMLRAGSRATTASAIDHAFGFPTGTSASGAVHPALNALTAHLVTTRSPTTEPGPAITDGQPPDPIVAIANGLFLARDSADSVQQSFLQLLAAQYGVTPIAADFTDPSSAAATLNRWVARQTRNRIRELFASIDPSTLLVLANAVYLKAQWAMQFDPSVTRIGTFRTPTGPVSAHLMNQTLPAAAYTEGAGWQRVAIAYSDHRLSMRVVVPSRPVTELAGLRAAMTAALQPITSSTPTSVRLTLPRWDTASDLDLATALPKLGLTLPFSSQADFTGIAPGLFVGQAVHRANITVDELGTEAAAVTGIAMATSGAIRSAVVRADRPFAWAIVHEPTGTPLFTGHVVDPGSH